jgi:ribonucleoside-triphosphate reductase
MTKKEIHQAVEGMYHNLNTLQSRSGGQLPFSSINYGTCTLPEGRLVIDALLEVSIEGLGSTGKTSIFPCGIFQYMKGVNDKPGTPNYDMYQKALRSTAQRLYPNYANCNWSAQMNWYKKDREDKQKFIDNMSNEDQNMLIEMLEKYPEYRDILGLDIINE